MVDRAKADVFMAKVEYHIEDNNAYRIKAAGMMEDYLKKRKKQDQIIYQAFLKYLN